MNYIENDKLKVGIADYGAELSSIYDKEHDYEVIWQADPAFWARHAPVLFPFVGKVNGGEYRYAGETYHMGQHGFARDMDFTLVKTTADSIVYNLKSNEDTKAKYPFAFDLTVTHKLEGNKVTVIWNVKNPADTDMYFSIGGHPAFNCPPNGEGNKEGYFVRFDEKEELNYVLIDAATEAVNIDDVKTLPLENGMIEVQESLFDDDALIFDGNQINKAEILFPDGSPYVSMDLSGFPSFGLWSKPKSGAPYICLEPWYGRCDAMGFDGELPEKYGMIKLGAAQEFTATFSITIA